MNTCQQSDAFQNKSHCSKKDLCAETDSWHDRICYAKTSEKKNWTNLQKIWGTKLSVQFLLSRLILVPKSRQKVPLNLFSCSQTTSPFHRQQVLSSLLFSWCEREEADRITHITEVETERVRAEGGDGSECRRHEGNARSKTWITWLSTHDFHNSSG